MAGFMRLMKETWKFYLAVLVIVLFLVLNNSVWICKKNNSDYGEKMFFYDMAKDSVNEFTKKNDIVFGKNLAQVYEEKVNNYEWLGYVSTIVIIIMIIFAKQIAFAQNRAKEFQATLPVKQVTGIIYDYLCILGILFIWTLLQGGIFLAYQTVYNKRVLETAKMFSIAEVNEGMTAEANEQLLIYMIMYSLFILVAYTWIYLWTVLSKNPIVGVITAIGIWYVIYVFVDTIGCKFIAIAYDSDSIEGFYVADFIENLIVSIESILSPFTYFYNLVRYIRNDDGGFMGLAGVVLVLVLVMLVLIVIAGSKRELTKGKLFYFPIWDYLISFIFGMGIVSYWTEGFGGHAMGLMGIIIGMILSVIICMLIHPFSIKKTSVWEVK